MGCSSSALKAGDNSKFRGGEESEPCGAQPKPCIPGRESTFYGNIQKEILPPLEKPKASVVPTANGVKSHHEPSMAKGVAPGKDATDQSKPTEKTQPLEELEESEPPQPGGKDDNPGAEEKKKDIETVTESQPLKGNDKTEPVGTETKGQPSRTAGERDSLKAGEGTENPQMAGIMKTFGTAENDLPLETARELQPQEAMGKDEQSQLLETIPQENGSSQILEESQFMEKVEEQKLQETLGKDEQSQLLNTIPKENESTEILAGSQFEETNEEQQLQETLGKDEQSQLRELIPKENAAAEMSDRSQLVQTPVMNDLFHKTPEGPRNMEQFQPEGIVGSIEHPAGIAETAANVDMAGKIHPNEEEQHIEGETGEKVETETENEKVSEGGETKEEETGEAVDLSVAP